MKKPVIAILADFPLFLVNDSFARAGWYYKVWLEVLYQSLREQPQFEIHWLVFCRRVWGVKRFQCGGQVFHVLPAVQGNLSQWMRYWWDCRRAHRELDSIAPDIIHAWGTETRYAIAAASYLGKCRKILSMQGILTACLQRSEMPAYYSRQVQLERPCMAAFDVITAESEWGCERCSEMLPEACVQKWEYAVDPVFYHVERKLSPQPLCLLAGTAEPMKNVQTAIAAFRRPELAHVQLLLAGVVPGQFADLPPNVKPLGGVDHRRMTELLAAAWCLVHPSLADTCPNIVKEARVAGVAVVTSTECGAKQYVEEGKSGFVTEPCDTEALVRAILAITRNAATAAQMGSHGQDSCRRALSAETMMRSLHHLYESELGKQHV